MPKYVGATVTAVGTGLLLATVLGTAAIGGAGLAAAGTPAGAGGLPAGVVPDADLPWVYKAAALCPQESPALIAAQLWRESNFNAQAVSPAGAKGIAQFTDGTWATWGRDDDGTGNVTPFNAADAIMAQGRYMCSLFDRAEKSGYPGGAEALALAGYNAGWAAVQQYGGVPPFPETTAYVAAVEAKAAEWAAAGISVPGAGAGSAAVRQAARWLGVPYVWGGGTPNGPSTGFCDPQGDGMLNGTCFASTHAGFDCSSLVQNAWWPNGAHLPRTAGEQYTATASRPVSMDALQPGDLIFYSHTGSGADAYHVVMYAGNGQVIEAPKTGKNVQLVRLYRSGGLVGATRPS